MRRDLGAVTLTLLALAIASGCKRSKPKEATHLWLGRAMGCATYTTGELACWGDNESKNSLRTVVTPTFETELGGEIPSSLQVDSYEACAVVARGRVRCWSEKPYSPIDEGAVETAGSCARMGDGRVLCWSSGAGEKPAEPDAVRGEKVARLVSAHVRMCALLVDARGVRCWELATIDKPVLAGVDVRSIAVGRYHACALLADRSVRCWGKNNEGQLGDGSTNDSAEPVPVHGLGDVTAIAAGERHTCALLANATVSCWGANERHQLANGTHANSPKPVPLFGLVGVAEIALADDSGCLRLTRDGEIRCWGDNRHAQLGDGSRVEHDVPMSVRSPR
jgi:hypothetical protein